MSNTTPKNKHTTESHQTELLKSHLENSSFKIDFYDFKMGEAKRRKELGLPPKIKKVSKIRNTENNISLSNFSINKLRSQYPAAPFVSVALILLVLQFGFALNS